MTEFILETNNLVKDYINKKEKIRAIDNLTLKIPKGAVALLGPNGSGKSTLIKIVLGLIKPTSGSYKLFNFENNYDGRTRIGYMPEIPSIINKVNGVKFVRHFAMLSGLNYTRAMQRTHEVLDYVRLGEERYRLIEKYSTGMKQRLLFAQSLVHDPEVIILDEPTSGLSPEGRLEMLDLIEEININYGKSILFSTHILPDVEDICNFTIVLNQGRLLFKGSMEDIKNIYKETVFLRTTDKQDQVSKLFSDQGYKAVFDQHKIIISSNTTLPDLQQINEVIKKVNTKLLSFKKHKPDLEDLFLSIIEKDIDG